MDVGAIKQVDIDQEMRAAYLDYAMSVIVSRALPDVRDGLKPVHRRILYAMYDMGLLPQKPYKKSARIVGEVLGKYHPHGDTAVYDAMVRMAQEFSLRYPLVDGQGNFGSIDGDSPAAMRYTEARLRALALELLSDIEKDTVDFGPNFDGTLQEPLVLPSLLPNLLVNGASGIAVGMTTNIPPHNLGEVCDALIYMIDRYKRIDQVTVDELMQFIHGPDFPTGGIVYRYGKAGQWTQGDGRATEDGQADLLASAYALGHGRFIMQAKVHVEEMSRSRHRIVITELPYQTNKGRLIERIAELVRDGRIEGISDLRDESDRQGMRLVIELTRTVEPEAVLQTLFQLTPMQQTFGMSMLALVDGEPRLLSLKQALRHYLEHRQEIVRRRSEYDLAKARERAHILEGLLKALANLDDVVSTIRRSRTTETARKNLVRRFHLTVAQAQAILDMPLKRLAALERKKLESEYKEKLALIAQLEDLLTHQRKILAAIKRELQALKAKYNDERRTQIVARDATQAMLTSRDLIADEDVWVTIAASGTIRRQPSVNLTKTALRQRGQGAAVALLTANTRDYLFLFTKDGHATRIGVHEIPDSEQGAHWADLCGLSRRDQVTAALTLAREIDREASAFLFLATQEGQVKRVALGEFIDAVGATPLVVMKVHRGDVLRWVIGTNGTSELMLVTTHGRSILFAEEEVRPMGLPAGGVGGIKLLKGDQVVACNVVPADPKAELLTVTTRGYAKRSLLSEYPRQGRYGSGVIAHRVSDRTGLLAGVTVVMPGAAPVLLTTAGGAVKAMDRLDVPQLGRSTQGKVVVRLARKDSIVALLAPTETFTGPTGEKNTLTGKAKNPGTRKRTKPARK